jgi:hypothetical protein
MWLKEREDLPNQPAKESTEHRRQSKYLSRPKSLFLMDCEAYLCSVAALGKKILQRLRKREDVLVPIFKKKYFIFSDIL